MIKKCKQFPSLDESVIQRRQPESSAGRGGAAGSERQRERPGGQRGSGPAAGHAAAAEARRGCAAGQRNAPQPGIAAWADSSAARGRKSPLAARPASSARERPAKGAIGARAACPGGRACHDCGRPTTDYRCEPCLDRWRKKHGVVDLDVLEETYGPC